MKYIFLSLLSIFLLFSIVSARWNSRDKGPYCSVRPVEHCCPGRNDRCTMPIHDSLCYCDIFCNETAHDCCPDFVDTCFGGNMKLVDDDDDDDDDGFGDDDFEDGVKNNCYNNGKLHKLGAEYSNNCNNCTCTNLGLELNWRCTLKTCLIRPEVLDYINNNKRGWLANNYTQFWGLSLEEGHRYRLGTRKPTSDVVQMSSVHKTEHERLPARFDSREEWPGLISDVSDQGNCASSWAVSTAGMATDRLHAHSNGVHMEVLSPQHFVSCNNDQGQHGCGSGHLDRAWWFMRKVGLVSTDCLEYTSGKTGKSTNCPLPRTYEALKNARCPSSGKTAKVFQASPPYRIAPLEEDIKLEIMTNGPVQAVMEVSDDFFTYQSGVYKRSMPAYFVNQGETSLDKHYHSVRLIGWGTEFTSEGRQVKYWIGANSWGSWWGENGYFRIERGINESQIESFVLGVWIKVNDRQLTQKRTGGQGGVHNHRQPPFMRKMKRHAAQRAAEAAREAAA